MSQPVLIGFIIVAFLILFSALWLGITGLLGKISGWGGLAEAFPDRPDQAIDKLSMQSARVGCLGYNNCLRFEICASGLRVSILRMLGPFSAPFFVPWGQISASHTRIVGFSYVELSLGARGEGRIAVRERVFERMAKVGNLRLA